MKNPLLFWQKLSIRTKVTVAQCVLIVLPLCLCVSLFVQSLMSESRSDNAIAMHDHNRSIVKSLDTSIRQLESLANTLAANASVKAYVSEPDEELRRELYQGSVTGLLNYAYNRYLPTREIELLPLTALDDLELSADVLHRRSAERVWTFDLQDRQLAAQYCYQFRGSDGQTGVIIFTPTAAMLQDTLESIRSIGSQTCAICTQDGRPLLMSDTDDMDAAAWLTRFAASANEGYTVLDDEYVGYCVCSETLPFQFVSIQRLARTLHFRQLLPLILMTLAIVTVCVVFSYQTLFRGITQRILSLSRACESITGQLEADKPSGRGLEQLSVPQMGLDEIGTLSLSINEMLSRITELTAINEQEVMISQKAAYDMLAAQIHPHFIYNTLENLRMMAETNDDEQVADLLYALGRMLHLSISDASSTGEVSMEFEHVQTYLQLQQMRLNDMIHFEILPPAEDVALQRCPRFLLQPVVENAIKHGFRQRKTAGHIRVESGYYDKGIYLRVSDDGVGMTEERLLSVEQALRTREPIPDTKGGIGLANVLSRLQMFYGPEARITLDFAPDQGTRCTLWLPIYSQNRPAPMPDGTRLASAR